LEGPRSFRKGPARDALDTLTAAARRDPSVRSVVSFLTTEDSLFLSRDERITFFLVSLKVSGGERITGSVRSLRGELRQDLPRVPNRDAYQLRLTGRSALDLDVRTVTTEDSGRLETRLLPLTLAILLLAFGALVAALLPLMVGVLAIGVSLSLIGILARL